jgi:hypothetical protein
VTFAEADALPPVPVQPSVYVAVPVAVGVSVVEPLVVSVPDHAPDAVQDAALVELHVSVVVAPSVMVEGAAVIVTVGCGTVTGLMVTVADPVILVYPGTVDAAVMVAVVIAASVAEEVNTPPVIMPAVVGLTDQVTTWLGLSCPATTAVHVLFCPAVRVVGVHEAVTEVTVVVGPVLLVPPPQPMMEIVKTPLRQTNSPSAIDKLERCNCLLRMIPLPFRLNEL